jgi:molybdopterin-biosynthesis enzyme MoeA-like protein
MQAMLDTLAPKLTTGARMIAQTIEAGNLPEGAYAADLGQVAEDNPELSIGSYPSFSDGKFQNQIVVRGKDQAKVGAAVAAIEAFLARLRAERGKS